GGRRRLPPGEAGRPRGGGTRPSPAPPPLGNGKVEVLAVVGIRFGRCVAAKRVQCCCGILERELDHVSDGRGAAPMLRFGGDSRLELACLSRDGEGRAQATQLTEDARESAAGFDGKRGQHEALRRIPGLPALCLALPW